MLRCLPKYFWPLCFLILALSTWLGYALVRKPQVTLDLYAYDIDGNGVEGADERGVSISGTDAWTLTRTVHDSKIVTFTPASSNKIQYQPLTIKVMWLPQAEYLQMLDKMETDILTRAPQKRKFWQDKFSGYRNSAGLQGKRIFKYPVIFERK